MRRSICAAVAAVLALAFATAAYADNSGRIHGKITTVDGDVFVGLIRWDKNEASWVDILHGNKEMTRDSQRKRQKKKYYKKKSIKIFGIPIGHSTSYSYDYGASQSGMRFGHIKAIEVIDDDAALIILKSGLKVELESGSSDVGDAIRELIIEDVNEGEIEFDWEDLEMVELSQGDANLDSYYGDRLYGTLTTGRGDEFTGWVCWDVDELFTRDVLDGEQKHRNRKVKFGKIAAIERHNSGAALVIMKNGEEMVLRGTNDVNDSNRGIVISEFGSGQIVVDWDEFDRLEFKQPPPPERYADFDGGHRLRGTVFTEDGEEFTGWIRWDDDEEYSWEILDGEFRGVEFDIEFGNIKSIERKGSRSSIITLWDGRTYRLRGTNDVDDDNKGIFIEMENGDEEEIDWYDLDKVEFSKG